MPTRGVKSGKLTTKLTQNTIYLFNLVQFFEFFCVDDFVFVSGYEFQFGPIDLADADAVHGDVEVTQSGERLVEVFLSAFPVREEEPEAEHSFTFIIRRAGLMSWVYVLGPSTARFMSWVLDMISAEPIRPMIAAHAPMHNRMGV